MPSESEAKQKAVGSPNEKGKIELLSQVTDPILIAFEPDPSIKNGSSIIVCPGGGYKILAIEKEGYEIAQWLTQLGYTAFVLQYRVPDKEDGALMDIQRAIRIVRGKAPSLNLIPDKVGVMGFSAGGSLCARASTRYSIPSYGKRDHLDSLSCRPDFSLLIYPAYLDKGEQGSLSPELLVDINTPPMFIFATADDKYSNSTLVMATALRDNKVPVELHLLPVGGHGYGLRPGKTAAEVWPGLAEIWLKNLLFEPK